MINIAGLQGVTLVNFLIGAGIALVLIELTPSPDAGHAQSAAAMMHAAPKPEHAPPQGVPKPQHTHPG